MNTNCSTKNFDFPQVKKRKVVANFNGGDITSDAGCLYLQQAENKLNLLSSVAKIFPDNRDKSKITHLMLSMLKQRIFGIALGYEDLNDHEFLRKDVAFQTSINEDGVLASSSTLCRLEQKANRNIAVEINKIFVEKFIESHETPPKELIIDFDATDDIVHGTQEGKAFNGYYKDYCFLPLYVFCKSHLLTAYLRRSNEDQAKHAGAIFSLLVRRLRQKWPNVKIIFRGDSGFCRHEMFSWCERNNVFYITGIGGNSRLKAMFQPLMDEAKSKFEETKEKQRLFSKLSYAAGSWSKSRTIVGKAEHTSQGANPRFVVTNLGGDPQELYDDCYCARGDMENKIKAVQLCLFSDRTSCHVWWANQFRMLVSALAYVLVDYIRINGLSGTFLENAQIDTIRLKLFKIGAVIVRNTRRVLLMLSSSYPYKALFEQVYERLVPG